MEAEIGGNPLFVWRNLLVARDLITEGTVWQIGDGQNIDVRRQRWLSNPPLFRPGADTNLKVGDLIDQHTKQWKRQLIYSTFSQSTAKEILSIKLGN